MPYAIFERSQLLLFLRCSNRFQCVLCKSGKQGSLQDIEHSCCHNAVEEGELSGCQCHDVRM